MLIKCSPFSAFWSITLAYNIDFLIQQTPLRSIGVATVVAPVVFVEIMIGLVVPTLFMLSIVPINSALRYITYDRVDIRKIMPKLLPFISFESGEKHDYWVAIGTFYFEIKDDNRQQCHETMETRRWYHLCDTTKSTVIIFFILAFNFLLAWTVFVNGTLVDEIGPESCRELTNIQRERAVCLTLGNISLVNCSAPDSDSVEGPLLCFQFLRFSEQMDILESLTGAIVLYFITEKFIGIVLEIIRFLYLFHKSWMWAGLVIVAGVGVIAADAALVMSALLQFTTSFDLGRIFEYLIIGLDIILVGVLLFISTPLEKAPKKWRPDVMTLDPVDGQSKETLLSSDDIEEGQEDGGSDNWERLEPASSLEEEGEDSRSADVVINEDALKEEEIEKEDCRNDEEIKLEDEKVDKEIIETKDEKVYPKKRNNFTVVAADNSRPRESPPQTNDTAVIHLEFGDDSDSDSLED